MVQLRNHGHHGRGRAVILLAPFLLLHGCGTILTQSQQPIAELPAIVQTQESKEMPQTEPTENRNEKVPAQAEEDLSPTLESEAPSDPAHTPSTAGRKPEDTEPPLVPAYQPGDTTTTWQPSLAENYPADEDCSDDLLLEKWMTVEGLTPADLEARGCEQLILAAAQPTDGVATLTVCYEQASDGHFVPAEGLARMQGFVGRNGVKHDRRRNSNTSPSGLWMISFAFGNEMPPEGLKLPWRQVTPNSDWVCDEDSIYFNTWQERGDPGHTEVWSDDVEHLEDYPEQYAYACVIEFNRPPDAVPARGCAIFLHCSEHGTGGCVGLHREDMICVMQWLDESKNPFILITGTERGA